MKAAWGEWSARKGVLVRIIDITGEVGLGEVAPLRYFGSESLNEAIQFLASIPTHTDLGELNAKMHAAPPASAFGIWSAIQDLLSGPRRRTVSGTAGLLSIGYNLEKSIRELKELGLRTFKIKVGLNDPDWEKSVLSELIDNLESTDRIRIDPNRSWRKSVLLNWSEWLAGYGQKIEFIEEPLAPKQISRNDIIKLAADLPVPLALDESLSTDGIRKWQDLGWSGYWILKPSLQGIPEWIQDFDPSKIVLSSIFETGIGLNALLSLSSKLPGIDHGLGTSSYFNDGLGLTPRNGRLHSLDKEELASIWNHFYKA